ncbi:helix-turn-helix transcriptional regulator [Pontibacter sp. HJ8]
MRIRSRIQGVDGFICDVTIADCYTSGSMLDEQEVKLEHALIKNLVSRQISSDGLCIIDTYMAFTAPVRDIIQVEGENIMFGFFFKGKALVNIEYLESQREYNNNMHYIRYTPSFRGAFDMPPHLDFNYFVVILSKAFYFRLLDATNQLHRDFAGKVLTGRHSNLTDELLEITPAMKRVIHDIRNTDRTGQIKRLFLEAKLMELLVLQLEQLEQKSQPAGSVLRGDDETRIQEARLILEAQYVHPPSLAQLSRLVGLNEFKLKQGFKECVGMTVHGYVVNLRMETARQLLQEMQLPIGDIALQVGYKSPAYFTAAFKKHYGILPSEVKN